MSFDSTTVGTLTKLDARRSELYLQKHTLDRRITILGLAEYVVLARTVAQTCTHIEFNAESFDDEMLVVAGPVYYTNREGELAPLVNEDFDYLFDDCDPLDLRSRGIWEPYMGDTEQPWRFDINQFLEDWGDHIDVPTAVGKVIA